MLLKFDFHLFCVQKLPNRNQLFCNHHFTSCTQGGIGRYLSTSELGELSGEMLSPVIAPQEPLMVSGVEKSVGTDVTI